MNKSKIIKVGNVLIGGGNPISIQSMTNTKTKNTEDTIKQIKLLEKEGCELIRVAVSDYEDAEAIKIIKSSISIPLIIDIQFDYKLAVMAAENGGDCIRINPGNIGNEIKVKEVVEACRFYNIPIRIGVNSGSISKKIIDKYNGVNENSLVESALSELEILEKFKFFNSKVSIKASDAKMNIESNILFRKKSDYPLHLGVTEAGGLLRGAIKSSIGIGTLLYMGIGDTIRVSLSDHPLQEIKVAKQILQSLGLRKFGVEIVSCPTCARTNINLIKMVDELEKRIDEIQGNYKIAVMGCVVNGPGEAREADFGITGKDGEGLIFRKGQVIERIEEDRLINRLIELINLESELDDKKYERTELK